uniref:Uncharacterized protein n=1 Tax=Chenopodium quinoa TaxID=63459 RepID=A0A803LKR4_CHEQI
MFGTKKKKVAKSPTVDPKLLNKISKKVVEEEENQNNRVKHIVTKNKSSNNCSEASSSKSTAKDQQNKQNSKTQKNNEKDGGVKEKETLKTEKVKVEKGKQSEKVDGVKNEKAHKKRKRDANEDVHEVVKLADAEDLDDYGKLQVRVGHFKFMTFVSNLSPSQKQAIIDMGFGALLDVNLPQNDQSFSAWLMHCFEENSRTLYLPYNKSIVVCEEDVEVVYGIPRGEKEVKEVEDEEQEETPLTRWRKD